MRSEIRKAPRLVALAGLLVACSSSNSSPSYEMVDTGTSDAATDTLLAGKPLTCAWFSSSTTNCWAAAIEDVRACAKTDVGTFSADGKTCTSTSATVAFDPPFTFDSTSFPNPFGFTIGTCVRFSATSTDLDFSHTMETARGKVSVQSTGGNLEITCPSGDVFSHASWASLAETCGAMSGSGSITGAALSGKDPIEFLLLGHPDGKQSAAWSCKR